MDKFKADWQDAAHVTALFGEQLSTARRRYRAFVQKGIAQGKRDDLVGGGLVRSAGGWAAVKALRKAKEYQKGDERILGDGEFVQSVIEQAKETFERKYCLRAEGVDLDFIANKAAKVIGIEPHLIWIKGKQPEIVKARSLFCYWATHELGYTQAQLSKKLSISAPAVSVSVARGRNLADECNHKL